MSNTISKMIVAAAVAAAVSVQADAGRIPSCSLTTSSFSEHSMPRIGIGLGG